VKRWFRPIAYSTIVGLAALALFGGESPADTAPAGTASASQVAPVVQRPRGQVGERRRVQALPLVRQRDGDAFPAALFAADALPSPPPAPTAPVAPTEAPPADLKVLGWMQSGQVPFVFVEWNGTSYTLQRSELVEDAYRFDEIGGGFASFTYLPTGESRRYAVSDPALLE